MEEAAYINPEVFRVNIVPLMTMRYVMTIAISTPKDSINYATRLQTITDDDGVPYFETISFGFACDVCNKEMTGEPCKHLYRKPASHKSIQNEKMGKRLLGDSAGAELEAVATATDILHFANLREDTYALPKIKSFPQTIQVIYSYNDIENGGQRSQHGVASVTRSRGMNIVVGLDRYQNKRDGHDDDNVRAMMILHYKRLFELPWITNNTIILIALEAQGGPRLPEIYKKHLLQYFSTTVPRRDHQLYFFELDNKRYPGLAGISVNDDVKDEWVGMFKKTLADRTLRFLERSHDPNIQGFVCNNYNETMELYWDQFQRYCGHLPLVANPQIQQARRMQHGAKRDGTDDIITAQLGAIRCMNRAQTWDYINLIFLKNHITRP